MTDREATPSIRRVDAPSLSPPPTYSHVSVVPPGAALAFLGGSVPLDADGQVVGAGDPAVLAAVWEVVEATELAVGPHSSTLVGVACLGYPGQLVETTAVALVPTEQVKHRS